MSTLKVNGASLYYDTFGADPSPLLILIPGAQGTGRIFQTVAPTLANRYKVICYDRRGYSRSPLHGKQDLANRLATDADDVAALIKHLNPSGTSSASVLGSSSGAIVAHTVLLRHPDLVSHVYAHEPPAFGVLPEPIRTQATGMTHDIYDLYRTSGVEAAMDVFTGIVSAKGSADHDAMVAALDSSDSDEKRANVLFWLEFEIRQYPCADVDVEGIVRLAEGRKYVPLAGMETGLDGPSVGPVRELAKALGRDVKTLPGAHLGFETHGVEWADAFLKLVE